MSNRLTIYEITKLSEVELIRQFFYDIFPEEPNYDLVDFKNSVTHSHNYLDLKYYLAFDKADLIGFCGFYSSKEKFNEAWLGWFGVRPKYRNQGYGNEMLELLEEFLGKIGYDTIRVYTDKNLNNNAYKMYLKHNYIEDSTYKYDFITMYKSLKNNEVERWQGIPLGFESEPPHHFS